MQDAFTDVTLFKFRLGMKASALDGPRRRRVWYEGEYYVPASRHDSLGEEQERERQEREELRRWNKKHRL